MGIKKYRDDMSGKVDNSGAIPFFTNWMGGPSLALVRNCPSPFGKRTVYIQGEADTYFTIPAAIEFRKKRINGYLMCEDGAYQFYPDRTETGIFPYAE